MNEIDVNTMGLTCRLKHIPKMTNKGDITNVAGDGWCLLSSLAKTREISPKALFFEMIDFLREKISGTPIRVNDLSGLFRAYFDKSVWFDDTLIIIFSNMFKITVNVYTPEGLNSYTPPTRRGEIDLLYTHQDLQYGHYQIYTTSVGCIKRTLWSECIDRVEWEGTVSEPIIFRGMDLMKVLQDVPAPFYEEFERMLRTKVFKTEGVYMMSENGINFIIFLKNQFYINIGDQNDAVYFIIESDKNEYQVLHNNLEWRADDDKHRGKIVNESYLRIDHITRSLDCSSDHLSDLHTKFKFCYVDLINWLYDYQLSKDTLELLLSLTPDNFESSGNINDVLGIKVIFHYGHEGNTDPYYYNSQNYPEYHIIIQNTGYCFLYKFNYANRSDKKNRDLLLLRRKKEFDSSTFPRFLELLTGYRGRLYKPSVDPKLQKNSITILKFLQTKVVRNVHELTFLLRLLEMHTSKTPLFKTDTQLDSKNTDEISLKHCIKKVGYSTNYYCLVLDGNSKLYYCSRREPSTVSVPSSRFVKYDKKVIKRASGMHIFPSLPNYTPNLVQYTPEPIRFTFPESSVYMSATTYEIPTFSIDLTDRKWIKITFEDKGTSISSHNDNSYILERINARTFIHDFTFNIIASSTDMEFSKAGLTLRDGNDHLTPDLIIRTDTDKYYIYEFTTRRNSSQFTMDKGTLSKDLRYRGMIEERSYKLGKDIFYGIITVTPQALQSNVVMMPRELCEELMFRMRVATVVFDSFVERQIEGCVDTESTIRQVKIESVFKVIDMENMKYITPFNKDMYEGFKKPISSEDVANHTQLVIDCFEMAKEEIVKDVKVDDESNIQTFNQIAEERFRSKLISFQDQYRIDYPIGTTRTDSKPPVQLPLIYSLNNEPQPTLENVSRMVTIFSCDHDCAHTRLISACARGVSNTETGENQEFDLVLMDKEERADAEKVAKRSRLKYRRVEYDLSEEDKINLAEIGPFGKKYRDIVTSARNYKKMPFDLVETDTTDISNFLNIGGLQLFTRDENMNHYEDIDSLLRDSLSLHNTSSLESYLKVYEFLRLTKIAHWARLVSDLGSELSISVKQFCKAGTAIFKRLKNYSVYLMIIPTGGPIFFSLLFPKEDVCYKSDSTVFKKINETEMYYYTEFVSVNPSKLRNLVIFESVLYSTFMLFAELCKLPIFGDLDPKSEEFKTTCGLTLLSLIICLDDKAKTEEICTLNRYVQMEGFVHFPKVMEQEKMLERINKNVRSRLELFISRCIVDCMVIYSKSPCRLIVQENRRQYKGIVIPYLQNENGQKRKCHSPELMLNVVYMGYIKNKDESAEVNALGQLVSKIIGWEDSLPHTSRFLGHDDPDPKTIQKHEFNTTAIRFLATKARDRIKKTLGVTNPTEYIGKLILDYLKKQSLEQFATLKASSNFDEKYYYYVPEPKSKRDSRRAKMDTAEKEGDNKTYSRSKVIVKLKDWLDNKNEKNEQSTLVVDLLLDALDQVEKNMCLHVCIFKKNQHAGLREIYVLNIAERIIQKTIEDISRAILTCFPSETMTHPNNKYRIPEEQAKESRRNLGSKYVNYNTSDDAKKWNQGHFVTKFICMLVQLTPDLFHGFICRSLQLWLDKRIMLPVEFIGLFQQLDEIHTRDEYVFRLFQAYKGNSVERWIEKGQSFIRTSSGFMQGILHYTSSLYHTIILDFISEIAQTHLSCQIKKLSSTTPSKAVVKNMQSSDDSAMMISVPVVDDESRINALLAFCCCIWFKFKEIYSLQLGIYKSEKSTTMTQFIMEFNSEFQFLGEVQKPTIRWVYASTLISEQETLVARQEEMSNTLKDVVEGGGSFILAMYCQIAQLILHYRLLGSGVSLFWGLYRNLIKKVRDPALGYFLMDNNICPGVLGFNYNLWNSYNSTVLAVRYKQQSMAESRAPIKETVKQITPDTLSLSLFTRLTTIRYGNKKIWEKIMRNMNFEDNIWDQIEDDPSILYYGAVDVDEVIKKMAIKIKSPGVVASLGKSNSLVRIISTGVYIMSRAVVSTQSAMFDKDGRRELNKEPLLQLLLEMNDQTDNFMRSVQTIRPETPEEVVVVRDMGNMVKISDRIEDHLISFRPDIHKEDIERSKLLYKSFLRKRMLQDDLASWTHFLFTVFNVPHQVYRNAYLTEKEFILSHASDLISTKWDDKNLRRIFYRNGELFIQITMASSLWDQRDIQMYTLDSDTRKLIFPFEIDYQSIKHNLELIDNTPLSYDPGHRRRTRTTLMIAGSESNDLFSLEEIAKYIWFRKQKPPLSESVILDLWTNFKMRYSFLQDTVEETLKSADCPFPNHISLRNFIARQDKGSRVIHLTGSHGKHGTQHANLLTIIKNNTSDNYNYDVPIIDVNKRVEHLNYETIMHTLSMLTELPLDDIVRNYMAEDLMSKSPVVNTNIYAQGGRRNKISIMQTLIQEDPDMIISSTITAEELRDYYERALRHKFTSYSEAQLRAYSERLIILTDDEPKDLPEQPDIPRDIINSFNMCWSSEISDIEMYYVEANWDNDLIDYLETRLNRNIVRLMARGRILTHNDALNLTNDFNQKRQKIIQNISLLKLGIIGGYTVRQKRTEQGIYEGFGIWEGHFNEVGIRIEVDTKEGKNVFTSIRVKRAPTDIDLFLNMLKTWSLDHHITYLPVQLKPTKPGTILSYIYENKLVKSFHKYVIPLVLDEHMDIIYNLSLSDFRLELTNHNLRLMAKVQNSDIREITTMQLKFTGRDINPNIRDIAPLDFSNIIAEWSPILSSWVSFEALNTEWLKFFSRSDMIHSALYQTGLRLDWGTNLFKNAIYRMNLDRNTQNISVELDSGESKLDLAIAQMINLSRNIETVLETMPEFSLEDINFDNIVELLDAEDVQDKNLESSSKLFVHPLLDQILNSAIQRFTSNVLKSLLRECTNPDFKLSENYSDLRPILEAYAGRIIDLVKPRRNYNLLDKLPKLN